MERLKWNIVFPDFQTFKDKLNAFSEGAVLDSDETFFKYLSGFYGNKVFLSNDEAIVVTLIFEKWNEVKNKWQRVLKEKEKEINELIKSRSSSEIFKGNDTQEGNEQALKRFFQNGADNEILPGVISFLGIVVNLPDIYKEIRRLFNEIFYLLNSKTVGQTLNEKIYTSDVIKMDPNEGFGGTAKDVHIKFKKDIDDLKNSHGGGGGGGNTESITRTVPEEGDQLNQKLLNIANQSDHKDLNDFLTRNETNIAANAVSIDVNATEIEVNADNIDALGDSVELNENLIATNESDIETNAAGIQENKDAIAELGTPETSEVEVTDSAAESISGTATTQAAVNIEVKDQFENLPTGGNTAELDVSDVATESLDPLATKQQGINQANKTAISALIKNGLAFNLKHDGLDWGGGVDLDQAAPLTYATLFHAALKIGTYSFRNEQQLGKLHLPTQQTGDEEYADSLILNVRPTPTEEGKPLEIDSEYHFTGYPVEDNNITPSTAKRFFEWQTPESGAVITEYNQVDEIDKFRLKVDAHPGLAHRTIKRTNFPSYNFFKLRMFQAVTELSCDWFLYKGNANYVGDVVTQGTIEGVVKQSKTIDFYLPIDFTFQAQAGFYYWFTVVFRHPTLAEILINNVNWIMFSTIKESISTTSSKPVYVTVNQGTEGTKLTAVTWDNRVFVTTYNPDDSTGPTPETEFPEDAWTELKTTEEIEGEFPEPKPTHKAYTKDQTEKFPKFKYLPNNSEGKKVLKRLNAHKYNDLIALTASVGTSTDGTVIANVQPKHYLVHIRKPDWQEQPPGTPGWDPDLNHNLNIFEQVLGGVVPSTNKAYSFITPLINDELINKVWSFSPFSYIKLSGNLGVKKISVKVFEVDQAQMDNNNYQDITQNFKTVASFSNDDPTQDYTRDPNTGTLHANLCFLKTSPDKFYFRMKKGFYYIAAFYSNDTSVEWTLSSQLYLTSRVVDESTQTFEPLPALFKSEIVRQPSKPNNQMHILTLTHRFGSELQYAHFYDTSLIDHPYLPHHWKKKLTPTGSIDLMRLSIKSTEEFLGMTNIDNEEQVIDFTTFESTSNKGRFSKPDGDLESNFFVPISYTTDGGVRVTKQKGGIQIPYNKGAKGMKMKVRIRFDAGGFNYSTTLSDIIIKRVYDTATHPKHAETLASFRDKVKTSSTTAYSSFYNWLEYVDLVLETGSKLIITFKSNDFSKGAPNASDTTPTTLIIEQLEVIEYLTYDNR